MNITVYLLQILLTMTNFGNGPIHILWNHNVIAINISTTLSGYFISNVNSKNCRMRFCDRAFY